MATELYHSGRRGLSEASTPRRRKGLRWLSGSSSWVAGSPASSPPTTSIAAASRRRAGGGRPSRRAGGDGALRRRRHRRGRHGGVLGHQPCLPVAAAAGPAPDRAAGGVERRDRRPAAHPRWGPRTATTLDGAVGAGFRTLDRPRRRASPTSWPWPAAPAARALILPHLMRHQLRRLRAGHRAPAPGAGVDPDRGRVGDGGGVGVHRRPRRHRGDGTLRRRPDGARRPRQRARRRRATSA